MELLQRARITPMSRVEDAKSGSCLNYYYDANQDSWYDNPEGIKLILPHLLESKKLESLMLQCYSELESNSPNTWRALGELLRTSTTLKCLVLTNVHTDGLGYIIDGILNNKGCVLEVLSLTFGMDTRRAADCDFHPAAKFFTDLLRGSRTLKVLELVPFSREVFWSWEEANSVAQGLVANTTLTHLLVSEQFSKFNGICQALTPPDESSHLQAGHNKTLKELWLRDLHVTSSVLASTCDSSQTIARMLQKNNSLEELYLQWFRWDSQSWIPIFHSLKSNKCLQVLEFYQCSGFDDTTLCSLMDVLDVNLTTTTIQFRKCHGTSIDWPETNLKVTALVERNRRLAKYMNFFEKVEYMQPKFLRLFLCGAPFAGKTTLRRSMVNCKAPLRRLLDRSARLVRAQGQDERTQGIEIRVLQGDNGERIAIWDMAGQEEYRALYDSHYLFPEINQGCLFLFVFRPINTSTGKFDPQATLGHLKEELCYWLMFINSNSRRARVRFPRISVVLTHWDKVTYWFPHVEDYVNWASAAVQEIRGSFTGRVEVHQNIYAVNSHSYTEVREIVHHILTNVGDVFTELPDMPVICQELSVILTEWNVKHKSEPILTTHRFFELCQRTLPKVLQDVVKDPSPSTQATNIHKPWHAILSYLNDVGMIVKMEKLDCIVVNVNWLGRNFLGRLFDTKNLRKFLRFSKHGIVEMLSLEVFLRDFIHTGSYKGLEVGTLIHLMKELKICEDTSLSLPESLSSSSQLFMPATLEDDHGNAYKGTRRLRWSEIQNNNGYNPVYTGFRLLCADPARTFLSPGVFLRFQVHLLRTLSKGESRSFDYELERNLIRVKHDGIEMLIESSGELKKAEFVDILIRIENFTTGRKQRAYEKGVSRFQQFCASGDGCPGVTLKEAILRPECVEKLILCKNRMNQAVSREDLRGMVVERLQRSMGETEESCLEGDYMHHFEAVKAFEEILPEAWVKASELLGATDFAAIVEQSAIDATERINGAVVDLERLTDLSISLCPKANTPSIVPEGIYNTESCQSQILPEPSHDVWQTDLNDHPPWGSIVKSQHVLIKNQSFMMRNQSFMIRNQSSMIRNQNLLMQAFQVQQGVLTEKLYQIYQVSQHSLPTIPYFTDFDSKLSERFISGIQLASAIRLHFMCEDPHQIHFIKHQEGLPISILRKGGLYKKLRPLVWSSFKMLYVLVKAGIHVGAGLGNMIPDIGAEAGVESKLTFLTTETFLNEIKISEGSQSQSDFRNAWKCLIHEVVGPIQDKIPEVFGLYRVMYKASYLQKPLSTPVHWICSKCRERAQREDWLEMENDMINPKGLLLKSDVKY